MKILGKLILGIVVLGSLIVGGAVIVPSLTKNRHSELAMAVDNVNPLVKTETVYASTTAKPVSSFIGGAGEKEYRYQLVTYTAKGDARTLAFESQWRLKPHCYLAITTKGQNVESWERVATQKVPASVRENLVMS
ncbi:YxeA family protein [Levilactobacillus namurensis]|uniref:YxeA family protein n=1 Tax=Levilactobacillus namurensis TaxID=380393 RepID=UPI002231437C|nr:YxeA family protein [Levilactobacillus namurensis]MCW3777387.1 YxeA family protein [Levilactobacillus namurensis]MDT7018546.1 YxeA family protein [Levilactobacillus namurensis]WNN64472.1 YxeA family protein [Levilactobacillus namurensis]